MTGDSSTHSVLFAHPVADLYGSDRQLLESVRAVTSAGHRAVVAIPQDGELAPRLQAANAEVIIFGFPVLRRSVISPFGIILFVWATIRFLLSSRAFLRSIGPDVVYVNTLTIPAWLAAARLARIPALCHVHEAEDEGSRLRRGVLTSPLKLATRIVVNSKAAEQCLTDVLPSLAPRIRLIYNGVSHPSAPSTRSNVSHSNGSARPASRIICVGRLSPRKGTDLALEAVAIVRRQGYDVSLTIAGSCFSGYEWFEADLRGRAAQSDLSGAVTFSGYVNDVYALLGTADLALVPSRREPFGNTAVEAQLASVPIIAARTQGLTEIVADGETGLLFTPDDATDLAAKITEVLDDPLSAHERATRARESAASSFSVGSYATAIRAEIGELATRRQERAVI